MSKQHHFTVWFDIETQQWDIGHARYDEDEPLFDTEEDEWTGLHGEDSVRDAELFEELRRRLSRGPR